MKCIVTERLIVRFHHPRSWGEWWLVVARAGRTRLIGGVRLVTVATGQGSTLHLVLGISIMAVIKYLLLFKDLFIHTELISTHLL